VYPFVREKTKTGVVNGKGQTMTLPEDDNAAGILSLIPFELGIIMHLFNFPNIDLFLYLKMN
jgi:hypothetical protein